MAQAKKVIKKATVKPAAKKPAAKKSVAKPVAKKPAAPKKPVAKKNPKDYFVHYSVKGRLGESYGTEYFSTEAKARAFANKVAAQKNATLIKWGENKLRNNK